MTYTSETSGSVPGLWVHRQLGAGGTKQPLAGPIQSGTAGLSFAYFNDASTAPIATPIANAATRAEVTRVRVVVQAISRGSQQGNQTSMADTVVISLRNRL